MAVTLEELAIALRLSEDGTGVEPGQLAVITRLLGVGEATVDLLIPDAPSAIRDECVVRLATYIFDQPPAGRRDSFANSWVNSGAGSLASRFKLQAASGSNGAAVGSAGGLSLEEVQNLITEHQDVVAAHHTPTTPGGGGGDGTDQDARDAAAAAQAEIDAHESTTHNTDPTARAAAAAAQGEIDTHEVSPHDTDPTARDAAAAAQGEIDTHESTTHNTDPTARAAAAAAQGEIDTHEGSPHDTDQTARDAAAAAQGAADTAQAAADTKTTQDQVDGRLTALVEAYALLSGGLITPGDLINPVVNNRYLTVNTAGNFQLVEGAPGGGGTPTPGEFTREVEVLYESAASETFTNSVWNELTMARWFTEADDAYDIELIFGDWAASVEANRRFTSKRISVAELRLRATSDDNLSGVGAYFFTTSAINSVFDAARNFNRTFGFRRGSTTDDTIISVAGVSMTNIQYVKIILLKPSYS